MTETAPLVESVSDTARWTAACRAHETGRPDALFHDPLAAALAGERGEAIANRMPHSFAEQAIVTRTVAVDRIVLAWARTHDRGTVLNLGAGLDARAYRLELPASLRWIDVDLPDIINSRRAVLDTRAPQCRAEAHALDLADTAARRLYFTALGEQSGPMLVLSEGLLQYLDESQVGALAHDLHAMPQAECWVTDIMSPAVGRMVHRAEQRIGWRAPAHSFAPEAGTAFFVPHGWRESGFIDFFMDAPSIGREGRGGWMLRQVARRLPARMRKVFERGVGVVTLARGCRAGSGGHDDKA
jgi:methyltransferase (TIGR00027 family)